MKDLDEFNRLNDDHAEDTAGNTHLASRNLRMNTLIRIITGRKKKIVPTYAAVASYWRRNLAHVNIYNPCGALGVRLGLWT
jgi:hypothetical protein